MFPTQLLNVSVLLSSFDNFLFDVDGVLHVNGTTSPTAVEFFDLLHKNNKSVRIVSNNVGWTPWNVSSVFRAEGFEHLGDDAVISPNHLTLDYFKAKGYENETVFVIGQPAIGETLEDALGMTIIGGLPNCSELDVTKDMGEVVFKYVTNLPRPKAVIVSSAIRNCMLDLAVIAHYLRDPTIEYFIMGADKYYYQSHDIRLPASASISASIFELTGRNPTILGKPSVALNNYLGKLRFDPKRTVMFGDNLLTDITMANENHFASCLTSTGVASPEDVRKSIDEKHLERVPTYFCDFKHFV